LALHALSARSMSMAPPLTQRQVRAGRVLLPRYCCCAHAERSSAQTLVKFFSFSAALLVLPVLLQYRGLEGARVHACSSPAQPLRALPAVAAC